MIFPLKCRLVKHAIFALFSTVKAGYPPQPLTVIPELPITSLGLKAGDQLTLLQKASANSSVPSDKPRVVPSSLGSPAAAMTGMTASQVGDWGSPGPVGASVTNGPDAVPMEGGYLVHRVSGYHGNDPTNDH